jgi:hypothetical protein
MSKRSLQLYFVLVLLILLWATLDATFDGFQGRIVNVSVGYQELLASRWGRATLCDTFFAFAVVWLWICSREEAWGPRLVWGLLIAALGNFAICAYALLQLRQLKAGEGLKELFGSGQRRASSH